MLVHHQKMERKTTWSLLLSTQWIKLAPLKVLSFTVFAPTTAYSSFHLLTYLRKALAGFCLGGALTRVDLRSTDSSIILCIKSFDLFWSSEL